MFERFRRNQAERRDDEGVSGARDLDRTDDGRSAPQYAGVGAPQQPQYRDTGTTTAPEAAAETEHTRALPPRADERYERDRDVVRGPAVSDVRARQRAEFGGTNWGSAFFGWLVALGLSALLVSLVAAAGASLGLTDAADDISSGDAETIGIVGGALFVGVLVIAYFAGGYVAGRMSRFDGARQGFAVWLVGIVVMLVLAALGLLLGSEYNVFAGLDLPRIPIEEGDLTTGGLIALGAVLLGTILAAVAGGKAGERYHVRVDRFGYDRDRV